MDSMAGQLVLDVRGDMLNELRIQYAHRHQSRSPTPTPARDPRSHRIAGVAGFGGPIGGTGQDNAGCDFKQNITQVIDNFTYIRGKHSYKFGFDWQHIYDERTTAPQFLYTFPTVAAYLAAKSGAQAVRLHDDVADHRRTWRST